MSSIDPRIKLGGFFLLSIFALLRREIFELVILGGILFIIVILERIPLIPLLKNLKHLFLMGSFIFIIHSIFAENLSKGLYTGTLITLRLSIMLIGASVLNLTTSFDELLRAIEWVLSPLRLLRFPVKEFSLVMMMAARLVPILEVKARRLIGKRPQDMVVSLIEEGLKEIDGFKEYQA